MMVSRYLFVHLEIEQPYLVFSDELLVHEVTDHVPAARHAVGGEGLHQPAVRGGVLVTHQVLEVGLQAVQVRLVGKARPARVQGC